VIQVKDQKVSSARHGVAVAMFVAASTPLRLRGPGMPRAASSVILINCRLRK
jgi:hypothetical protein